MREREAGESWGALSNTWHKPVFPSSSSNGYRDEPMCVTLNRRIIRRNPGASFRHSKGPRKSKFENSDALFWLTFSAILVLIAIVSRSPTQSSNSPSNFVFFAIMAILLYRMFLPYHESQPFARKRLIRSQKSRSTGATRFREEQRSLTTGSLAGFNKSIGGAGTIPYACCIASRIAWYTFGRSPEGARLAQSSLKTRFQAPFRSSSRPRFPAAPPRRWQQARPRSSQPQAERSKNPQSTAQAENAIRPEAASHPYARGVRTSRSQDRILPPSAQRAVPRP